MRKLNGNAIEGGSPAKQCRRTAGLRPWKPGQSGNPKGRTRKSRALSELIREHAAVKAGKGKTRLHALIDRLYIEDPKTYLAYGWGKPVETVELSGPEVEPVEFCIQLTPEELP